MWSAFWGFIAKMFNAVFSIMPSMGLWFNKLIMIVGVIALVIWLNEMRKHKEVEKFD